MSYQFTTTKNNLLKRLVIRVFLFYNIYGDIMKFHLSIVLDKEGYNRYDLYSTNTLRELDEYIKSFSDSQEVRDKYNEEVSEFLLDNMETIMNSEHRNNRTNNGRICIVYEGKNNTLRMFSILYKNDGYLMDKEKCLSRIKTALDDDSKIREIINRKRYLLSEYEIDLISDYLMYPVSYKRYKRMFINDFIRRLSKFSDDNLYMVLRSLMNICDLVYGKNSVKTKKGVINNINLYMPSETTLKRESIVSDCNDEIFMRLYQEGNFEELYSLYDADEIDNYLKNDKMMRGKR